MGKGSDWPLFPTGPGTVEEVGSGVAAAASPTQTHGEGYCVGFRFRTDARCNSLSRGH